MQFSSLLTYTSQYAIVSMPPGADVDITFVTADSRRAAPGALFVAIPGGAVDGHGFISDALARGAVAVVGEREISGLPVPYSRVSDSRMALAVFAAALHGFPARQLTVIGVTGTDGKTTTANLIFHVLRLAGLRAGMISTVNAVIGEEEMDTGFHVTTPDALQVQSFLRRMVDAQLTHVVLEATSHGLAQARVAACDFDLGVVTNITHEHLDYHGSYAAYQAAKGRLFEWLSQTPQKEHQPPRAAALNRDDLSYDYLLGVMAVPLLSYGIQLGDVHVVEQEGVLYRSTAAGIECRIAGRDLDGKDFSIAAAARLTGDFNLYNLLAAVTVTRGLLRLPDEAVRLGLAAMPGVPGRMEAIDSGQDFIALVDFAHTPNALSSALQAARRLARGRVIAVFGSAGLRDRQKRRMMAETAAELGDVSVLTAEDPRTESLDAILAEMAAGAESRGAVEGRSYWRIPDRREALRFAVSLARSGDVVIACGKGHEQSMCFGETEYNWDDRIALRAALAERLGIDGPPMPYLPLG